ncbi:hypothetical protein WJ47_12515 [Burkholderia ubonensis]|uniref:Uncharacterized protein n=1 Tax=Burkholderia ubonensis TaxID=101571 RepID=A0AB73FQQ5_9BURK|nr:hypothetical protein [Burkholderia ubonensis]KVL66170.1 hypothetical protein WJ47_12515 [Burkholderia ubonensis]KVM19905.1 hypothetical protein WJ53_22585 [Burkholderia ubonensis]KVM26790.1 hypothetical protein WJ54_16200 [Burkholderia ubonensis]
MPLLNIDLVRLSSDVVPANARDLFDAMPVRARLATLSIISDQAGNTSVRDVALHALTVIDAPAYVGLSAVKSVLQSCRSLLRIPADRVDFLVGAGSSAVPQREGYAEIVKWPRKESDRWILTVTARDMADAMANR